MCSPVAKGLKTGVTLANFQSVEKIPVWIDFSNMPVSEQFARTPVEASGLPMINFR